MMKNVTSFVEILNFKKYSKKGKSFGIYRLFVPTAPNIKLRACIEKNNKYTMFTLKII